MFLTAEELKAILPDPKNVVEGLSKYIIGQEDAKKALSLMVLRRGLIGLQTAGMISRTTQFDKSNVLLIGSTGTGKTSIMRALSEVLGCPIGIYDVTDVTASGYYGKNIENILERFVLQCETWAENNAYNLLPTLEELSHMSDEEVLKGPKSMASLVKETVNNGILYLDEIDKIRKKETRGNDVGGESVQNELLKILENGIVDLWQDNRKFTIPSKYNITSVNTKNLTLVCGGAFDGIEEIVKHRIKQKSGIGFNSEIVIIDKKDILKSVTTEDLVQYGLKPEFLGRIPLKTCLNSLSLSDMKSIITVPKGSLYEQYKLVFKLFNIDFKLEEKALDHVASSCLKLKIGARGLKQIFTSVLTDVLYDLYSYSDKELVITEQYVKDRI